MEGIKYGRSTVVVDGVSREVETRSVGVGTEEVRAHCCACRCSWRSAAPPIVAWHGLVLHGDVAPCRCTGNVYPLYVQPTVNSPSRVYSAPSDHSVGCEPLVKQELRRHGDDIRRCNGLVKNDERPTNRLPKLSCSTVNVNDSTKDEDALSPRELIIYTNDFLTCSKCPRKEENLTCDEDPLDKSFVSRTVSERTVYSSRSTKKVQNGWREGGEAEVKRRSVGDGDRRMLERLLQPNRRTTEDEHVLGDTRQRLMGDQLFDAVRMRSPPPPPPPLTGEHAAAQSPDDLPMMMMINTLVAKHASTNDSKLNQLLNHIESVSSSGGGGETPASRRPGKRTAAPRRSPTSADDVASD